MFSKLIDNHLLQNRKLLLVLTAGILWGVQLVVVLVLLLAIKGYLQATIEEELQQALSRFIDKNKKEIVSPEGYGAVFDESGLEGVNFVRIIKDNEQILYASSTDRDLDFRTLAELDPHMDGSWVQLFEEQSVWNILSRTPTDSLVIQVGARDRFLHRMYQNLVTLAWLSTIPTFLVALLLAYVGFRLSLFPLNYLAEHLATIQTDAEARLDTSSAGIKEHQIVIQRVNHIIVQNQQLVKEMQDSLDNVAHDLRTPMTRLRSIAEYGLQAGNDAEKLRNALSDCLEESERVLAMLRIMMSVAEAESGTMQLNNSDFNLFENLSDIVELYEYSAQDEEVEIILDIPEDLWLQGDRTRLSQVWANLIDNGIKYNSPRGRVKITGRSDQHRLEIIFEDTGRGISAHEIDRIWDRLYRGDRSRSRHGLGLGLNYVKAVIMAHGGTIDVISRLNEGTQFRVVLDGCTQQKEL